MTKLATFFVKKRSPLSKAVPVGFVPYVLRGVC